MKKSILITIGITIILIIVGIWFYLFMYGTPKSADDVFARFNTGGNAETSSATPDTSTVDVASATDAGIPQKLKQLTTRPVAGASFTTDGIEYAEQGTGHIYRINLGTGEETLISGTTIPQTFDAHFSKDGSYVALTSHEAGEIKTIVGKVENSENKDNAAERVALPDGATEIAFGKATSSVYYLISGTAGSSGYSYNIDTKKGTEIFNIALGDVRVVWGDPIYVYTTPTAYQKGYVYRVKSNELMYVAPGGAGLTAVPYSNGVVVTTKETTGLVSTAYDIKNIHGVPLIYISEKCTQNPAMNNHLYCAVPANATSGKFPDDWYKGSVSYIDVLWDTDISNKEASPLSDFLSDSGREIDVSKIGTDSEGKYIYFVNKNDNTLWMFDTTIQ